MNVAILGFDIEGTASYNYFVSRGDTVTICDQDINKQIPDGVASVLGPQYLDNLDRFDLLVRTPGMNPSIILEKNPDVSAKITSATNIFMGACPTRNVIGVTGTKGKGTTSTLITKILQASGKKVFLGGNIGVPALSFLHEVGTDDWVVLELSSFQLIDVQFSPHIAVVLMIVPEHLNWHKDLNDYINAKRQLVTHQNADDLVVYNAGNHNSIDIAQSSRAQKLWYRVDDENSLTETSELNQGAYVRNDTIFLGETEIAKTNEAALLGRHNLQNICAAIAATWEAIDHNIEAIRSVITSFHGLEHRLELVRDINGVAYYDDSFGTTPETAIVAIQSFSQPKVVILGGSDKGADFDALADTVLSGNVRQVILMGNTNNPEYPTASIKIQDALQARGFDAVTSMVGPGGPKMSEVVAAAHDAAQPGDVVLLSAGCASFDMFQNYKDRAAQFQNAVRAL